MVVGHRHCTIQKDRPTDRTPSTVSRCLITRSTHRRHRAGPSARAMDLKSSSSSYPQRRWPRPQTALGEHACWRAVACKKIERERGRAREHSAHSVASELDEEKTGARAEFIPRAATLAPFDVGKDGTSACQRFAPQASRGCLRGTAARTAECPRGADTCVLSDGAAPS